jgi:hypothetical protein
MNSYIYINTFIISLIKEYVIVQLEVMIIHVIVDRISFMMD